MLPECPKRLIDYLQTAMDDDFYLPLPRESHPGEPTSWVATKYPNSWVPREKLLAIPTLSGRNLFVGIAEVNTDPVNIKGIGVVRCRFIVDTDKQSRGPVLIVGENQKGQEVVVRRSTDRVAKDSLPPFLQEVADKFSGEITRQESAQNDAFAGFLQTVLANRGAYATPSLPPNLEQLQEAQDEAEQRCLNYLFADLVISGN